MGLELAIMQTKVEAPDLLFGDGTEPPWSKECGVKAPGVADADAQLLSAAFRSSTAQPECQAHGEPSAEYLQRIENELPFLRRSVRRWHREQADADDLVQDTLVQALANAHLWEPGSDLRAWLFTIMRNRFLAGAIRSTRSAAAMERIGAARSAPLAEEGELRLILRDLSAALRRLP